jgi:hypothetical protein
MVLSLVTIFKCTVSVLLRASTQLINHHYHSPTDLGLAKLKLSLTEYLLPHRSLPTAAGNSYSTWYHVKSHSFRGHMSGITQYPPFFNRFLLLSIQSQGPSGDGVLQTCPSFFSWVTAHDTNTPHSACPSFVNGHKWWISTRTGYSFSFLIPLAYSSWECKSQGPQWQEITVPQQDWR